MFAPYSDELQAVSPQVRQTNSPSYLKAPQLGYGGVVGFSSPPARGGVAPASGDELVGAADAEGGVRQ